MKFSDVLIYGYLGLLSLGSIIYAFIVILYGGSSNAPLHINVGLPPDIILNDSLLSQLNQIENVTTGVSVDVWWGEVETSPLQYNWSLYEGLFADIHTSLNNTKSKIRVKLNFHACVDYSVCGTNNITLPKWILDMNDPNFFYMDVNNYTSKEYLSSGVDHLNLFPPYNRSAVEMYADFAQAFAQMFQNYFDLLIYEVQIGLGPDGELRYPAFPLSKWHIPGVGQFQCYDKNLQTEFLTYTGKTKYQFAYLPSAQAVQYDDTPGNATFFSRPSVNGSTSEYGQFFLNWYSGRLLQHGGVILSQMSSIFKTYSPNITIAARIGCIYWQNADPSHAAEVTAGYTNYTILAEMLQAYNVRMVYPCFDLSDRTASANLIDAHAAPQQLVTEMLQTAKTIGLKVEGTNTLNYAESDFDLIVANVKHNPTPLVGFNYNYLSEALLNDIKGFRHFVDQLNATKK